MKKFSSLKIKYQISLMVSVLVLFQVILFGVSYFALDNINSKFNDLFEKRLPSIDNLVQADRDFQQALVAERTLLLPGLSEEQKQSQVKDYIKNRKQVIERFESYQKLATLPKEKDHIALFNGKYKKWLASSIELFKVDENGLVGNLSTLQENSLGTLANLFESSRDELDALQEVILGQAEKDFKQSQTDFLQTKWQMYGLIGISFILSLITSFFCIRAINSKIQKTIDLISQESGQLNSISDDLSQRASGLASASAQQAASVTQTSSSLHEISQMVKNNTTSAVSSADLIKNGKIQLDQSLRMIFELAERVQDINNATAELVNKVDTNHTKFGEILNVFNNVQEKTSVINDIVFQTKLLSFNASVEAARAGEHGKGFAVVAEEVGNLAQMSGKSADEISYLLSSSLENINSIITNSKSEVSGAVSKNEGIIQQTMKISKECEDVLKQVEKMFDVITDSSTKIAQASKEQDIGVDEINSAVQEINNSNQITSDNASQVEDRSNQLVLVVNNLKGSIEDLKKAV